MYLRRLEVISISHRPPPLCDDDTPDDTMGPHHKDAVLIFHDECIYHSNDGQGWMWGEKRETANKAQGSWQRNYAKRFCGRA